MEDLVITKRKRGRPKGPAPEGGVIRQWQPKKWTPSHEQVVTMYVMGYNQEIIAEKMGFTPAHINNIINCEQGRNYSKLVIETIRRKTTGDLTDRMARLTDKAINRIESGLSDEKLFAEKPLQVMDRSFRFLEGNKTLSKKDEGVTNNTNVTNISVENLNILNAAAKSALEARKLYEAKSIDSSIETV